MQCTECSVYVNLGLATGQSVCKTDQKARLNLLLKTASDGDARTDSGIHVPFQTECSKQAAIGKARSPMVAVAREQWRFYVGAGGATPHFLVLHPCSA